MESNVAPTDSWFHEAMSDKPSEPKGLSLTDCGQGCLCFSNREGCVC